MEVDYILNTKGAELTPDMAQKLQRHKVRVALSLDGIGRADDQFPRFSSGRVSFVVVDRNLDTLLANGCSVRIETTLGDHNCGSLKELVDYITYKKAIYSCDITLEIQTNTIVPKDWLDSKAMDDMINEIIEAVLYAREKGLDALAGMVTLPFTTLLGKRHPGSYCKAIGEELCVYPNGDIYPCGNIKMRMGNVEDMNGIFTSKAYLKMSQRIAGNISACRGCDIEAFGAGGCAADAMASNGDIFSRSMNCDLEKLVFKAFVKKFLLGSEGREKISSNY
jgi:radical SAM protein with 4Fe4S-binding SPASM domain